MTITLRVKKTLIKLSTTNVLLTCLVCLGITSNTAIAQQVGTIGVGDISYSAATTKIQSKENVISALDSGIKAALIKTRKFTVLDYAQLEKRLSKQGRTLQGFYTKKYEPSAYGQAGLDYILTANVTEFDLFKQTRGKSENAIGLVDVEFTLHGVADVTEDNTGSVSAQLSRRITATGIQFGQDLLDNTLELAVDQLVDQVISGLFPVRVMKIAEDGAITLNYGQGLLAPGDTVLVYPLDADVIVDASGDIIGDAVATLQVITAERKFAIAQALGGQDLLVKGQKAQLLRSGG